MSDKKYCPNCGDRISHKVTRCPYCGQAVWNARVVMIWVIVAVIIVAAIFLLLDYLNIEVFK